MARYSWRKGGGGVREVSRLLFGVAQTSKSAVSRVSKPAGSRSNPAKIQPKNEARDQGQSRLIKVNKG